MVHTLVFAWTFLDNTEIALRASCSMAYLWKPILFLPSLQKTPQGSKVKVDFSSSSLSVTSLDYLFSSSVVSASFFLLCSTFHSFAYLSSMFTRVFITFFQYYSWETDSSLPTSGSMKWGLWDLVSRILLSDSYFYVPRLFFYIF